MTVEENGICIDLACAGYLLGHAVDCAEAEDQVSTVDADDFAIEEIFRKDVQRNAVIRIVEDRNENEFVGNVEIGIARGKSLSIEIDWSGHREFFYAKLPPSLIFALFENREILLEMGVISVVFIFLDNR